MDASEVYDRQIRLWGMEAQKRMQEARVLFCGLRALPAEICKNVILAGINVALLDAETVTHEDLCAQFFLRPEHVGMNRAEACLPGVREMNPLATVECHTSPPSSLPDTFFSSFDIIVASDLPPSQLIRLDALMRERGREAGRGGGFMYADTFGLHGWAFPAAPKEFTLSYPSLQEALSEPWSSLKNRFPVPRVFVMGRLLGIFDEKHGCRPSPSASGKEVALFVSESQAALLENGLEEGFLSEEELRALAISGRTELSPVCAVIGGILGQEILKAVSRKGEPALNCFLWDGETHEGRVIQVPPPAVKR
ncbi:sumo-activating enzyme subunit 1 [Nannochloropsis oceanica]